MHRSAHYQEHYGSIKTARRAGISLRQLYYWVDTAHVVTPQLEQCGIREFRRYTEEDVEKLQKIRQLVEGGLTLQAAATLVRDNWKKEWMSKILVVDDEPMVVKVLKKRPDAKA